MFKLVVLFAMVAVAAAKPGFLAPALAPAVTRTAVIGTSTIEAHGSSIVHAAAPVTTSIVSPTVVESRSVLPAIAPVAAPIAPVAAPLISSYSAPLLSSSVYGSPLLAGGYGYNGFNGFNGFF